MLIQDLSYCEVVSENVVGGYGAYVDKDVNIDVAVSQDFDVNIDVDINKDVDATLDSAVNISGNFAQATFDVTAIGADTFAEADVAVTVTDDLSEVSGTLTAAVY